MLGRFFPKLTSFQSHAAIAIVAVVGWVFVVVPLWRFSRARFFSQSNLKEIQRRFCQSLVAFFSLKNRLTRWLAAALELIVIFVFGLWVGWHREVVWAKVTKVFHIGTAAVTASPSPVETELPSLSFAVTSPAPGLSPPTTVSSEMFRLTKRAQAARETGHTVNALALLEDAVKRDPKNADALAEMAMIYESIQNFDKSAEIWRRVQEIGPSAGTLYEVADMKLKVEVPTKETHAEGIPSGSTLAIREVAVSETPNPNSETNLTLRITVNKRPDAVIDHTKLKIQVFFYDTVDDNEIRLTDADVSYEWLRPNPNWHDSNSETLALTYVRPKSKASPRPGSSVRKYLGYIVRVYYDDQLQDKRADPPRLLNLFPAPFTAPPVEHIDEKASQLIDQAGREWLEQKELRRATYGKAFKAFEAENFIETLKELDALDARQPALAGSKNLRGVLFMRWGLYDKAEAAFHEALRIDPKFWNARVNLAEIPFLEKGWVEARNRFQELLSTSNASELQGDDTQLIQYKILLTYLLEGKENMVDSILAKFELSRDTPAVHYANAAIALQQKNTKKAKDWIAQAEKNYSPESNKMFKESLYEVGWLQKQAGQARAALGFATAPERMADPKAFARSRVEQTPKHTPAGPAQVEGDDKSSSVKIGSKEYVVQKFPAPGASLSIDSYVDFEHDDAFVRLVRLKDKHVISSIPFRRQKARALRIEWSPDGKFAALSFKSGEAGAESMRLFRVSNEGLSELKLPNGLHVDALLPADDPARKAPLSFAAVEPDHWLNSTDLLCQVIGSARLFETPVIKPGYLTIAYDVTLRCDATQKVAILRSKQTQYANSDDGIAMVISPAEPNYAEMAKVYEKYAATSDPVAEVNLGSLYRIGKGVAQNYEKAAELFAKAAQQGYAPGQAYLATEYAQGRAVPRDYAKAAELFHKAIEHDDPAALNEFAWYLATFPDDSQRNGKQAVIYAERACEITYFKDRNFVDTLAAAYAETGDFSQAVRFQEQAIGLDGDYPEKKEMEKALQLYRDGKPFRDSK